MGGVIRLTMNGRIPTKLSSERNLNLRQKVARFRSCVRFAMPVMIGASMSKLSVNDLNVKNQRVLVRVDFNVPMEEKDGKMVINDTTSIKETLPTLRLLSEKGAKIILAAHLGRPKGKREPSMSLRPVAEKLSEMIGQPVSFADDCI